MNDGGEEQPPGDGPPPNNQPVRKDDEGRPGDAAGDGEEAVAYGQQRTQDGDASVLERPAKRSRMSRFQPERLQFMLWVPDPQKNIRDNYRTLRDFGQLVDGAFVSTDDEEFVIHKAFVAIVWPSLKPELEERSLIRLNLSSRAMQALVSLLYGAEDHNLVNESNIDELFNFQRYEEVPTLVEACRKFFRSKMSMDNCLYILRKAAARGESCVQNEAYDYIMKNFTDMYQSEFLVELTSSELAHVLVSDTVMAKSEVILLDALAKWVLREQDSREAVGKYLLSRIRFGMLLAERNFTTMHDIAEAYPSLREWDAWLDEEFHRRLVELSEGRGGMVGSEAKFSFFNELYRPRKPGHTIFTLGGWTETRPTSSTELYDIRCDRWFSIGSMPNTVQVPRAYHGTAVVGTKVYIFGGYDGSGTAAGCYKSLHMVDMAVHAPNWQTLANMHSVRCYVASCVVDGEIWAIGGMENDIRLNTVERYNIEQNQWYLMPSMTTRRSDAAAVNHRGTVYVCGGFDSLAVLSTVEYFDAKASQWKRLVRAMPVGLSGLCALSYQGNLVVLGGFTGENRTSQVLRYNDIDMQWESMPDMNMARSNFSAAVIDNKMFTFGGFHDGQTLRSVECFDHEAPGGPLWCNLQPMKIPKSAMGVTVIPTYICPYSYVEYLGLYGDDVVPQEEAPGQPIERSSLSTIPENEVWQVTDEDPE